MTAHISLESLSLEAADDIFEHEVKPSDALEEEVDNPTHQKEFEDLQKVFDTYITIVQRGCVCRSDIDAVKDIAPDYPALKKLLDRYPVNSFTAEPSRVNYEVSTEGFVKTAFTAVVNALREVIRYIVNAFKAMWRFMSANKARTQAVDDIASKMTATQTYIVEVERVMSQTALAQDYSAWARRAKDTQIHNLNKTWNGLKHIAATDPARLRGYFDSLTRVIRGKLPPFAEALDTFMKDIKSARTEQDVMTAIAKMELTDMASDHLTTLANDLGYRAGAMRVDRRMTNFQSMAVHVRNSLRSWDNDRNEEVDRETFNRLLLNIEIVPWADELEGTISLSQRTIEVINRKLEGFKESDLAQGLDDVYATHLTPFMAALTSIVQSFITLEQCVGMVVSARDNAAISIGKAALGVAKSVDQFILKNKDKLTVAEKTLIWRYRSNLTGVFKAE